MPEAHSAAESSYANLPVDGRAADTSALDHNGELETLARIASRYYLEDRTQAEIAAEFGISRQKVQRLLRQAREQHVVEIHVHAPPAQRLELESRLRETFGLQQALVAPTHPDELERRFLVGRAAASYLERHVGDEVIIAVGLGRNVATTAQFFQSGRPASCTFVSAMGGSPRFGQSINPNEICAALASRIQGRSEALYAPAYVEDRVVRDLLYSQDAVIHTLSIARRADVIIMGIGTAGDDSILVVAGCVSWDEIRDLRASGAVGEMLGNYFDCDGRWVHSALEGRSVGLTVEEIRQIPVVVAVASEEEKTPAVLGALRTGLIQVLIVESQLASAVLRLAGEKDVEAHSLPG